MRRFALTLLFTIAVHAIAQDAPFVFGREQVLSPIEYGNAPGQRERATVVTNGQDYLGVFIDHEGGPLSVARFTHDGVLLDEPAIGITTYMHGASAIWTGTHYLIIWTAYEWWPNVYTRTLTSEGVLGEVHAAGVAETGRIQLATDGNTVAVVFESGRTLIVDSNGLPVSTPPTAAHYNRTESHVAALEGGGYLIASAAAFYYQAIRSVEVFAVDAEGHATARSVVAASPTLTSATLCANKDGALLIWSDAGIKTQQLNSDGSPAGAVRTVATFVAPAFRLAVEPRGSDLVLTFEQSDGALSQAFMMRMDRDGNAIDAPEPVVADVFYGLSVASRPDGTAGVVWVDDRHQAQAAFVDAWPVRTLAPALEPARTAHEQSGVRLASTSRGVVALWDERDGTSDEIRLGFPGGAQVTVWKGARSARTVRLLSMDDVLWAFWMDETQYLNDSRLFVRRYTRTLRAIDREPLLLVTGFDEATAAAGGGVVLAAWNGFDPFDVRAAVLRPLGDALNVTPVRVTNSQEEEGDVDAAWDGASFAVGFTQLTDEDEDEWELRAVRVDPRGEVLDASPLPVVPAPLPSTTFRMAPSRLGAAFVWMDGSAVNALTLRDGVAVGARSIPLSPTSNFRITPMEDGFALLREQAGYGLVVDVLSATFAPRSSRAVTPAIRSSVRLEDIVIHDGVPVIAYGRATLGAPYGATSRAFIRQARPVQAH